MARKKYHVNLEEEERQRLQELTSKGTLKARKFKRALILLKADQGMQDAQIMRAVSVSRADPQTLRRRWFGQRIE